MMNNISAKLGIALAIVGLCMFAGCKKSESPTVEGQVAAVDTSDAEKEFQSAPPEVKTQFDQAIAAVRSGEYSNAISKLQDVAKDVKLTAGQQQAIKDLIATVQKAVTEGAGKAVEGAEKAIDDVKSALPK